MQIPLVVANADGTASAAPAAIWTQTQGDSAGVVFDLGAWTGQDSPNESWTLQAAEAETVYFAVRKAAAASITAVGQGADAVDQAEPGELMDGSRANELLAVFAVDTSGAFFDPVEKRFTLAVSRGGQTVKTLSVTVKTGPNPTGVGLFRKGERGRWERITAQNVADHANSWYATHRSGGFPDWGIAIDDVTNLATALKWLDAYPRSGTPEQWEEYLVRVVADEALPKTTVSCYLNPNEALADYVRIRLRGYGAERRITHERTNTSYVYQKDGSSYLPHGDGFLNIGVKPNDYTGKNHLALHLEDLTIDAEEGADGNFPGSLGPRISSMVYVGPNCALVMEEGSKLTGFNGSGFSGYYPVYLYYYGRFELNGGALTSMTEIPALIGMAYVAYQNSVFIYRSGTITDCSSIKVQLSPSTSVNYTDPRFKP